MYFDHRLRMAFVLCVFAFLSVTCVHAQTPAPLPRPDLQLLTNGTVYAIARQPDGGVIIGGEFSSVNGVTRRNLARLLPDGSLDPDWNPAPDSYVNALAVGADGTVYASGNFTIIGGLSRPLAKISSAGVAVVDASWNPNVFVSSMAVDSNGWLYIAGAFAQILGEPHANLARLSTTGVGAADSNWNPATNGYVRTLCLSADGYVYIGGDFSSAGALQRSRIARVMQAGSGAVDAVWNPGANANVTSLVVDAGGSVYVAGAFTTIGGLARKGLAKLSGTGAGDAISAWNPSPSSPVRTIALDGADALLVGGDFSQLGSTIQPYLAKVYLDSGAVNPSWHPQLESRVYAVAVSASGLVYAGGIFKAVADQRHLAFATLLRAGAGAIASRPMVDVESPGSVLALAAQPDGGVVVGGDFSKAGQQERLNILRVDPSGQLDPVWNPGADRSVRYLAADTDGSIFAAGAFGRIGGLPRDIAKVTPSGTVDPNWAAFVNGGVTALAVDASGSLYVGGAFTTIGGPAFGQPHKYVAKLSGQTAVVDPSWDPALNAFGYVRAIAVMADGSTFIGGDFMSAGGLTRNRIAKLGSNGSVDASWNPGADSIVQSLALDAAGTLYVGGNFSAIGGQQHRRLAKLSVDGVGVVDAAWTPRIYGVVTDIMPGPPGEIFIAGDFETVNEIPRRGLAKFATEGVGDVDIDWNPAADKGTNALAYKDDELLVGGPFTLIGGQTRLALAALPLPRATTTSLDAPAATVVGETYAITFNVVSTSGASSGSVTVTDDAGAGCGPVVLSAGSGSCSLASSVAGTRLLTATFTPDTAVFAASSSTIPHVVDPAATQLSLSIAPEPATPADSGVATIALAVNAPGAGAPSGNIVIIDEASGASCLVILPQSSCSLPPGGEGIHALQAFYEGDGNFLPSTTTVEHTVHDRQVDVAVDSVTPEPSVVGEPVAVAFSLTAADNAAGGTVSVDASTGEHCAAPVSAAACSLVFAVDGPRTLIASYSGDATHDAAQSPGIAHVVNDAATTLAITSHAPDPSLPLQPVEVSVVLSVTSPGAGSPVGGISVSDGIESCMIQPGESSCSLALSTRGPRSLTATYSGDGNFGASSAQVVHHVNRLPLAANASYAANQDAPLEVAAAQGVLVGASDPDGDALEVTNVGAQSAAGIGGTVVLNADGAFVYTPPAGQHGVATFDYTISDGRETATASVTITVAAGVDLSVSIDDATDFAQGGGLVAYTIVAHNAGPGDAVGARVRDLLPSNLVDALWSCSASSGASCTSDGSGDIDEVVSIASGASVTYLLSATVVADPETLLSNTATVLAPANVPDANGVNNSATDVDAVGIFADGFDHELAPDATAPATNAPARAVRAARM